VAVLPIYTYGSVVLRKKTKPIVEVDDAIIKLIYDMFDTMNNAKGIGLAANQVGESVSLAVLDLSGMEEYKDTKPMVLINPEIVTTSGKSVLEEGCLSIPGIREEVTRAETIRVRFKDPDMDEKELTCNGLLARAIQHEVDHLNGVLIIDYLSAIKRKLLRGELNKIKRGEVEADYPLMQPVKVNG